MVNEDRRRLESIMRDFRRARRRAALEAILARLRGNSTDLLPYEEVRKKLQAGEARPRGIRDVPLDAIVGSVGRYPDFTRKFLPRRKSDKDRWARIKLLMSSPTEGAELPPIDVYKLGDAYFVADGNHRVSVAREQGAKLIRARVTEIETRVPLSPEDDYDDVILKAEYAEFLNHTDLDKIYPELELTTTVPGQYAVIERRIDAYHQWMKRTRSQEVAYTEAIREWYESDYCPIIEIIRERRLLLDFPDRTETDLYVWTLKHRDALRESLGWSVDPDRAADDLADQYSKRPERRLKRFGRRLIEAIPDDLETGPEPGHWRRQLVEARKDSRLFASILVAVNGKESGWYAVDQAIAIAQHGGSRLRGLHVGSSEAYAQQENVRHIEEEFLRRCRDAEIDGEFAFEQGEVARTLCDRAEWSDLVVVSLTHPPGTNPIERLGSGIRKIVQRCPRPVLTVPSTTVTPLRRALLAYDDSPKAGEALFVAGHLAYMWNIALTVVTVDDDEQTARRTLSHVREYLSGYDIEVDYTNTSGRVGRSLVNVAEAGEVDIIIMGGFGAGPVVEMMLGSTVDYILRTSWKPTLICR